MRPRNTLLIFAAAMLGLIVCQGISDQAAARLVQDDRADPANPAIAEGGIHLRRGPRPPIQYSLIGAFAAEGRWFAQCALLPWQLIGMPSFRHTWAGQHAPNRPAVPWIPPSMP